MSRVILFNKPYQVLSQFRDEQGRATLADYIQVKGVYPAGRLDYDSEGLLLLTDDGALQHRISHPAAKLDKTYWVQVEGDPNDQDLQPLRDGIELADGPCRPANVTLMAEPQLWPRQPPIRQRDNIPTRWLCLRISEGRNRQVRRMTAAIGLPTLRLVRYAIGHWTLDGLAPGDYRQETVHLPADKPRRHKHQRGRAPSAKRSRRP